MGNNNKYFEETNHAKCQVCKNLVMVDSFGQGDCRNCGWVQSEDGVHNYHMVRYPNFVSFARAKDLNKDGQKIKPRLEDFMGMLTAYSEVGFILNNKQYAVIFSEDGNIKFFVDNGIVLDTFSSTDEFVENAKIENAVLRDIWDKVTEADWLI